jgi:NADPH-dependent 2,4-dienoyl-CoA reductase/sulfur reductase-like enzyme
LVKKVVGAEEEGEYTSNLEAEISRAIIKAFHEKLCENVSCDVVVAGAGPSGLMAGYCLAREGSKVTISEKRFSPGGGGRTAFDCHGRAFLRTGSGSRYARRNRGRLPVQVIKRPEELTG